MTVIGFYRRLLPLFLSAALIMGAMVAGAMTTDHIRAAAAADLVFSGVELCASGGDGEGEGHVHCDYCHIAFSADLPPIIVAPVFTKGRHLGTVQTPESPRLQRPRWLHPPSTAPPAQI